MKKIILAGGTGFIGSILTSHFTNMNYEVVILSRNHHVNTQNISYEKWDGRTLGHWQKSLENAEALINLNGKSVDCRYTKINKQLIYNTRIDATNILGKAVGLCQNPPKVWINGGSATIYPHSLDKPMTESNDKFDPGFSVDVCQKWEAAFHQHNSPNVRKIILRIAIVMGKENGAFIPLKNLVKTGLGGSHGSGNQMISWLHEKDMANIIQFCIDNQQISGVYNASAPNPVKNSLFMKLLRKQLLRPPAIPIPKIFLKMGAKLIGTETELILKSRYVIPKKLLNAGFQFEYSEIEEAINDLCN